MSHIPQKFESTRIWMPLSDTFSETADINLPNDQMKNGCLPHFFVKFNHKVHATNTLCNIVLMFIQTHYKGYFNLQLSNKLIL